LEFHYPIVGAPATPLYYRRGLFRAHLLGRAANISMAHIHLQDQNGTANEESMLPLEIDATALSQAVDLDLTVLGGLVFHLYGQGRMLAQGLETQYASKPSSRIPVFA
jgi:hypothetical protein